MSIVADRVLESRARRVGERLRPALPAGASVLDVGSGTGHNAAYLRQAHAFHVVETDVTSMRPLFASPIIFDGEHLPFADNAFDVVTMCFVLHYARRPERLLAEALRVAPRVVVLQSTYEPQPPWPRWASHRALRVRDALMGRLALRLSNALGYTPGSPAEVLAPRRFYSRAGLLGLCGDVGASAVFHDPGVSTPFGLRRELLALERSAQA